MSTVLLVELQKDFPRRAAHQFFHHHCFESLTGKWLSLSPSLYRFFYNCINKIQSPGFKANNITHFERTVY